MKFLSSKSIILVAAIIVGFTFASCKGKEKSTSEADPLKGIDRKSKKTAHKAPKEPKVDKKNDDDKVKEFEGVVGERKADSKVSIYESAQFKKKRRKRNKKNKVKNVTFK
jgi:type IV secretory pathway VirB10-like protein